MAKIGDLRRYLFLPFACKWNGIVRDITAQHETEGEEVSQYEVFKDIVSLIRQEGHLDYSFPCEPSRLHKLFDGTEEPVNPESHPATKDSYVAWLRWLGDEAHRHLVVCDSDAEGAFRVYRWPERSRP